MCIEFRKISDFDRGILLIMKWSYMQDKEYYGEGGENMDKYRINIKKDLERIRWKTELFILVK